MNEGTRVTLYLPRKLLSEIDAHAILQNRNRSNMAATLLESSIKALKYALDNPKPYPSLPEAPADTDEVE